MLSSTYAALRTQGLSAKPLMRAAAMNYGNGTGRENYLPDGVSHRFWREMASARRAFRHKTGFDIETVIAK